MTASSVVIECRQTSGTPCSASSSRRAGLAQRGEVAPQAPLGQQPEGAVDRRGPQADQVRAPAQPLADRAVIQRRHPDRRHQVAADEVGEHARVDAVGLASQRRDRLDLARVGDLDRPATRAAGCRGPRPRRSSSRCSRGRPVPSRATSRARPSSSAAIVPSVSSPLARRARTMPRGGCPSRCRDTARHPPRVEAVVLASAESSARGGRTAQRGPLVLHDSRSARCRASPASRIRAASLGKMPTTSVRRPISRLKRSSGFVDRSLGQCSAGNA